MTTAADVLNEARRWIGTAEQPAGSNNVPGVTDWYGLRGAWCAMFVSRVFHNAGLPIPATTPKGFAWVSAGFDWMRKQGWYTFTDWRDAQPGDLVAWEWGTTGGGFDHISIVEANGPFTTIGGNERDRVKREFFGAPGGAALFARPPYAKPQPVLPTKGTKMIDGALSPSTGRAERVRIIDGKVWLRWQIAPNGMWSDLVCLHTPGDDPGGFDNVTIYPNEDGRLEILAFHSAYGVECTKVQNADGTWRPWAQV